MNERSAQQKAAKLARAHYENFTVVCGLLPRPLRQDVAALYAYCRTVDDIGDAAPGDRLAQLDIWAEDLARVWTGYPRHPVLQLLQKTVDRHHLAPEQFARLVEANRRDQRKQRYADWDELLDYASYSANPVGRLYLALLGYSAAELLELSDATCTALQLTNFWQDISRDAKMGRIYIPQTELARFAISEDDILQGRDSKASAVLLAHLCDYTSDLFRKGMALPPFLPGRYAASVRLFTAGGEAILARVRERRASAFSQRPTLSRLDKFTLACKVLLPRRTSAAERRAFAYCAQITRREAGNFRAAIATLSRRRRRAMYAVYAYCRIVDDTADLAPTPQAATGGLALLRQQLDECLAGRPAGPLFTALAATRAEFPLQADHLRAVLAGVEQDLRVTRYPTFAALQKYCWQVASAVGLLSLGVFGSRSPKAAARAADLGYAMQLTNILRDVREDMQLDRIYLPQEDMERFKVTEADFRSGVNKAACRELFAFEAARANTYFTSAQQLLPMVPFRSRFCLMALQTIYKEILNQIVLSNYDVLARRISLSGKQKLAIIGRVWWQWLWSGM